MTSTMFASIAQGRLLTDPIHQPEKTFTPWVNIHSRTKLMIDHYIVWHSNRLELNQSAFYIYSRELQEFSSHFLPLLFSIFIFFLLIRRPSLVFDFYRVLLLMQVDFGRTFVIYFWVSTSSLVSELFVNLARLSLYKETLNCTLK